MATTAKQTPSEAAASLPARRRFTVDEYYRMTEAGILRPDERVELIEGDIIRMAAIGGWHAMCVDTLNRWAVIGVGDRAIIRVQNPVRLSSGSEPEPDRSLLHPWPDRYRDGLISEVADTSLRYDRQTEIPLYATSGIPEARIVDIDRRRIIASRSPRDGEYTLMMTIAAGGTVAPEAFPALTLRVDGLFA